MSNSSNTFISGLIAGTTGSLAVYPIDVVKTKMQNQSVKLYKNGFDCFSQLYRQGGIKSFYKGSIIQMIGVGPEKAIKLFAYTYVTKNNINSIQTHFIGGLVAGFCQVLITCPYEMIKINLQMSNKIDYTILKKIYTGAPACFLRDIPFSGIYFPMYWFLKEKKEYNSFIAGTLAGAPAALLCTPADVIKTRQQTISKNNNTTLLSTIKNIYINEGFKAFWKGGIWRMIRSAPQFGITLVIFDKLQKI
jgi:solute carrier family 25 aspartate/glutamate transporter 12/13